MRLIGETCLLDLVQRHFVPVLKLVQDVVIDFERFDPQAPAPPGSLDIVYDLYTPRHHLSDGHHRATAAYQPLNTGGRFSKKARAASWWSAVWPVRRWARASAKGYARPLRLNAS